VIDAEDMARLKEVFVTRQECNTQMDDVSAKLSNDNARLAVIESKLDEVRKLEWCVIAGVIGLIISAIGGLILK
jgi:hypothetical protein